MRNWRNTLLNWQAFLICLALIFIYGWLASRHLWLPGIYYDEVLQVVPAIAALKGGVNGPMIQVEGSIIRLGGHPFPLLILPYLGATQAGILTLVFAIADISIPVIRSTFVILGVIPLILTFLFTRRLFNTGTAIVGTLLLAVDPTYIFSLRSDNGPTAVMMICKLGALWLLITWWQTRKPVHLWMGAFLCGFGLYDKVNFIWFLGALVVSVVVIDYHRLWDRIKSMKWSTLGRAAVGFCGGASVMLLYTLLTRGGPFRNLLSLTHKQTAFGVDNTNLLSNLSIRLHSLYGLLSGYEILDFYTSTFGGYQYPYNRGFFPTTAIPWLVGLAILALSLQLLFRAKWGLNEKKALFLLLLSVLIVGASIITPTNLMYHHLLLVYPFFHLLAAHFITTIPEFIRVWWFDQLENWAKRTVSYGLGGLVVAVAVVTSLGVTSNYYRVLEETGGIGMWSDAIYDLANYLEGDERTVVVMDWGINLNLLALTEGELHTLEPWQQFLYSGDYSPEMEALISDPGRVYIFHAPRYSGVLAITQEDLPRQAFFNTVEAIGATATFEKSFAQRDGDLLFELYTVTDPQLERTTQTKYNSFN